MPNGIARLLETVRFMAAEGSSLNMRNMLGESPLISVTRAAISFPEGAEAVAKELLIRGADPNKADMMGETALMEAASCGFCRLGKLLLEHHADPNALSKSSLTPLLLAEQAEQHEFIGLLKSKTAELATEKALERREQKRKAEEAEKERQDRAQELLAEPEREGEVVDRNPFRSQKEFKGVPRSQARPAPGRDYPEQGTLHDID